MAAGPQHLGGNDILNMNRSADMSVTMDLHVLVDIKMRMMNVIDSLNAHAGDTWQESDVAGQA